MYTTVNSLTLFPLKSKKNLYYYYYFFFGGGGIYLTYTITTLEGLDYYNEESYKSIFKIGLWLRKLKNFIKRS